MQLDVRGPRFAATVTTVVLIAILLTGSGWLAAAQAVVFLAGAISARTMLYGVLYRKLVAPRLAKATEFEPSEPVRFAQGVGFVFAAVAAAGFLSGVPVVGFVAAAFALIAAFLNAAFGFCLGCEMYLLLRRAFGPRTA
ncbi:hypothetical protein F4553_000386 [Allocatelliglobosispora scoriae]|uniref:DUF4395 domain-containing protein n=1 Tax=Allocatelliglobosispora scoriae TaxID=643052 RepID=A0A841BD24_9ACTN|nr:DUF4395 domain-containing protein [Allocatelliglobosispora scoriae]MBB5867007.1 hypothetical protein [Allocatelliglobosispora scoriae]